MAWYSATGIPVLLPEHVQSKEAPAKLLVPDCMSASSTASSLRMTSPAESTNEYSIFNDRGSVRKKLTMCGMSVIKL
jgi:hypothetical protein